MTYDDLVIHFKTAGRAARITTAFRLWRGDAAVPLPGTPPRLADDLALYRAACEQAARAAMTDDELCELGDRCRAWNEAEQLAERVLWRDA